MPGRDTLEIDRRPVGPANIRKRDDTHTLIERREHRVRPGLAVATRDGDDLRVDVRGEVAPRVHGGRVVLVDEEHPVPRTPDHVAGGDRQPVAGGGYQRDTVGVTADHVGE